MKRSKILVIAAALCLGLSATGCGAASGGSKVSYYATEEELAAASAEMSAELNSGDIYIEGKVYQMPFVSGEFCDAGWEYDDEVIERAGTFPELTRFTGVTMYQTDENGETTKELSLVLVNETEEKKDIKDVYITSIGFDRYEKIKLIFPSGITWESKIADVEAAYGTPEHKDEVGNDVFMKTVLQYEYENAHVAFTFEKESDAEEEKLTGIKYSCLGFLE